VIERLGVALKHYKLFYGQIKERSLKTGLKFFSPISYGQILSFHASLGFFFVFLIQYLCMVDHFFISGSCKDAMPSLLESIMDFSILFTAAPLWPILPKKILKDHFFCGFSQDGVHPSFSFLLTISTLLTASSLLTICYFSAGLFPL